MSHHPELKRALKRYGRARDAVGRALTRALRWLHIRQVRGDFMGTDGLPLEGARVTLGDLRSTLTDSEGRFSFWVLGGSYSLSIAWGGVELRRWVRLQTRDDGPTEVRLRWPSLIRGQILCERQLPAQGVEVSLNGQYRTFSDSYGAFSFPRFEGEEVSFERFVFQVGGRSFVHHFRPNLPSDPLHVFLLQRGELFHVRDLPHTAPFTELRANLSLRYRAAQWVGWCFLALLMASPLFRPALPAPPPPPPEAMLRAHLMSTVTSAAPGRAEPPEPPRARLDEDEEEEEERVALEDEPSRCDAIEFSYRQYKVPRGMEGFLLALLFGSWQRWDGDLAPLNDINEDRQLQAGQFVRLMLPLHEWRLFTLQPQEGAAELRAALACDEAQINTCLQLAQVWNPHLDLRALRKGDQLLINPSLLQPGAFPAEAYRRLEKLKRLRGFRASRPRVSTPLGCALRPLRASGPSP